MSKYTVAIIGAGRIAATFDTPKSDKVLTHAHAFTKNPATELSGFFDTDFAKASSAAQAWSTVAFRSLDELLAKRPDIIVIAGPDATHAEYLRKVEQYCKVIICEKPAAYSRSTHLLLNQATFTVPIIVNYRRHFDSTTMQLRERIAKGEFGNVIHATGTYSNGLLHNGAHMIDTARFLFGEIADLHALGEERPDKVGMNRDALLTFEKCPRFFLLGASEEAYSVFELDILCEKGRIRFTDEGFNCEISSVTPDPVFHGFNILAVTSLEKTGLIDSMSALAEHAVAVLNGSVSHSDLHNALLTEKACFNVLER